MSEASYIQDIPYTWSYFDYQNPIQMAYVARLNGFNAPRIDRPFTYCDLGCGNGVTANLLADALPNGQFYGIDFNAEHIENAKAFAAHLPNQNAHFVNASFADLPDDLPQFDFIAMHGIYSWVSLEIRNQTLDIVKKYLAPGGLLYVSYNCLPGWAELMPLWKMIQTSTTKPTENSVEKAQAGLAYLSLLRDNNAAYFKASPRAADYVGSLLKRDTSYLTHEFINASFEPQYFIDVADDMAGCELSYAGTARLYRNDLANIVPAKFAKHVQSAGSRTEAESRASFVRNEFFRRDIFAKDEPQSEGSADFPGMIVAVSEAAHRVKPYARYSQRRIRFEGPVFEAVLSLVTQGQHEFSAIVNDATVAEFSPDDVAAALHNLIQSDQYRVQSAPLIPATILPGARYRIPSAMNRAFLGRMVTDDSKVYLSSPVLGAAIRLSLLPALVARSLHEKSVEEAKPILLKTLRQIAKKRPGVLGDFGRPDSQKADNQIAAFTKRHLPRLLGIGVLESS